MRKSEFHKIILFVALRPPHSCGHGPMVIMTWQGIQFLVKCLIKSSNQSENKNWQSYCLSAWLPLQMKTEISLSVEIQVACVYLFIKRCLTTSYHFSIIKRYILTRNSNGKANYQFCTFSRIISGKIMIVMMLMWMCDSNKWMDIIQPFDITPITRS